MKHRPMLRKALVAVVLLIMMQAAGAAEDERASFRFGVFPYLSPLKMDAVFAPVSQKLAELLNQLPFLSSVSDTVERGIAEVVAFTDAIQELVDEAKTAIDGLPDTVVLSDIVGAINGLTLSPVGRRHMLRVQCADWERVPWFDAVNHHRFILHGVGYSSRYQGERPRIVVAFNCSVN